MKYYEKRFVVKSELESKNFYSRSENNFQLIDALFENDNIVLLGNPGIGKTTELENLFRNLWNRKKESGFVPLHIILKFFRKTYKFEDLITFENWKNLPGIVFILDGLDEIRDIHDFLSEFELFISKNSSRNFKYVISCRTNIYEKFLIKISNFSIFYLQNLNFQQIVNLLKKKHNLDYENFNLKRKHHELLASPFFLDLFANYYKEKKKLPELDSEIWDLYVQKTINDHRQKLEKKGWLNKPELIKNLKKVAIVNELMQRNYIFEEELHKLTDTNFHSFLENPFLNFNSDIDGWSFEHRQIQEYFVARSMSDKTFEDILDIIKIEEIEAIHPSIFNSLTFLINLIDENSPTFQKLVEWLINNQVEILFKADSNRISRNLKNEVFQNYFYKESIQKTYWINSNKKFEIDDLINFADTKENLNYLINLIEENTIHERAIISAWERLSAFDLSSDDIKLFEELIPSLLQDNKLKAGIKAQILWFIERQSIHQFSKDFINNIFEVFQNTSNKEINRRLLGILSQYTEVDDFADFLKNEFLRENKISVRDDFDNVVRGNEYILEQLVVRFKNPKNLFSIIKYYFQPNYRSNLRDLPDPFKSKLKSLIEVNHDEIFTFLNLIDDKINFHTHDLLISELIKKSKKLEEVIIFLLDKYAFEDIEYFLSSLITKNHFQLIIEHLLNHPEIDSKKIEGFRNLISNRNERDLAIQFEKMMLKHGYDFKEKGLTDEEIKNWMEESKAKTQAGFDLLFEPKNLLIEIKKTFFSQFEIIDHELLFKFRRDWYDDNGHGSIISPLYLLLENLLYNRENKSLKFEDFRQLIDEDKRYELISSFFKTTQNQKQNFTISSEQKGKIYEWVIKKFKGLDFNQILKSNTGNRFSYGNEYNLFKELMFLSLKFKFDIPKDYLLKSIKFYQFDNYIDDSSDYTKLKELVNDDDKFNKQIIQNIHSNNLFDFVLYRHIMYAINQNLSETIEDIVSNLNEEFDYLGMENIEKLFSFLVLNRGKGFGIKTLKEFSINNNNRLRWNSIKILMNNDVEKEFCLQTAISYLDSDDIENYYPEALEVLFLFNDERAMRYLIDFINEQSVSRIRFVSFGNYSAITDYSILPNIYFIFYRDQESNYENHYLRNFFNTYIINLSKDDSGFTKVQEQLKIIKDKLTEKKQDLFYINLLIEDSKKSYIKFKSKPYSFNLAYSKSNKLLN